MKRRRRRRWFYSTDGEGSATQEAPDGQRRSLNKLMCVCRCDAELFRRFKAAGFLCVRRYLMKHTTLKTKASTDQRNRTPPDLQTSRPPQQNILTWVFSASDSILNYFQETSTCVSERWDSRDAQCFEVRQQHRDSEGTAVEAFIMPLICHWGSETNCVN